LIPETTVAVPIVILPPGYKALATVKVFPSGSLSFVNTDELTATLISVEVTSFCATGGLFPGTTLGITSIDNIALSVAPPVPNPT